MQLSERTQRIGAILISTLFVSILAFRNATVFAGEFNAYGPFTFTRDANAPDTITNTFSVLNPNTTYTLKIWNGLEDSSLERVSSSILKINGIQVAGPSDLNQNIDYFEKQVTLSSSTTITIEVRGKPGGGLTVRIVGVDNEQPTIAASVSPAPNTNGWHQSDPTVSFTCFDGISGIASCAQPVVVQTEGVQSVTGNGVDKAGNTTSTSVTVRLDKSVPTIQVISHSNGETVSGTPISIAGTVADAVSGISGVSCNGAAATITGGSFSCDIDLEEGENSISVQAFDVAGNTATVGLNLTLSSIVDPEPPVLNVTTPVNGSLFNASVISVSATVTDNVKVKSVTINGNPAAINSGSFSGSVNLSDGANTITVVAKDAAGNETPVTIQVSRYAIPEITIASPADLSWTNTTSITVTGSISDPDGTVNVNGVSATASGGAFSAANVPLIEGGNVLTATITDSRGRIASSSVRVIRDLTPPEVAIDFPQAGAVIHESKVSVTGLINDITMGTVHDHHAQVTVNGITASVSNRSFLAPDLPLLPGLNTILAVAVDRLGNSNSITIQVTYDPNPAQAAIRIVSGNDQIASINTEVTQPLVVELKDASGGVVSGKTVIFKVVENNGTLTCVGSTPCPQGIFQAVTAIPTAKRRYDGGLDREQAQETMWCRHHRLDLRVRCFLLQPEGWALRPRSTWIRERTSTELAA